MAAVTDPPVADLADLADLCTPWCVHVVATLRIADLIAAGATDVTDLAARAGCDAGALGRVLRHLAGKGLFEQAAPGRFVLNEAADRVTVTGQSFFVDPLPAGASLYLLKNVLADWPDREATAILARCAEAARPDGRVVVLGGVSRAEDGEPSPELLMMILVGGKDRTLAEFGDLAGQAGLEVTAVGRQPSGRLLVECRPSGSTGPPGPEAGGS